MISTSLSSNLLPKYHEINALQPLIINKLQFLLRVVDHKNHVIIEKKIVVIFKKVNL